MQCIRTCILYKKWGLVVKNILINIITVVIVIAVILILLFSFGSDEGARYVYKGNTTHSPVSIKAKEYQCSECNMNIESLSYAAQAIAENGNTYFFDDIGCAVLWLKKNGTDIDTIFTQTQDTHQWIDTKKAWYTRTASSPMGYGFAAYEKFQEGFIPYDEMKLFMLQGKNLHDPFIKKKLLNH